MDQKTSQLVAPILIIGSGLAGYTVIREIRKLDKTVPITLVTREPGYFYSKPMLSTALAGRKASEQLITTGPEGMETQLGITIIGSSTVSAIDTHLQTVATNHDLLSYSKLVLALGAEQMHIPMQGNAVDTVLTVNDLEDYALFRQAIAGKKKVVILGAGLIGCEFANDLAADNYEVDVIDLAPQVLGRLLPEAAAVELQAKLSALGIRWHFNTTIQAIDQRAANLEITLTNGSILTSDVVLSAVGLKPRLGLAQAAGIATRQGIQVNRQLETSARNVYAIGDCAEVDGLVLPYVMPIMQAARALAPNLLGQETIVLYPAMPVMVKTPALPTVISPPAKDAQGQWQIKNSEGSLEARFESADGSLLGFVLMGTATAQRSALTKELPPLLK